MGTARPSAVWPECAGCHLQLSSQIEFVTAVGLTTERSGIGRCWLGYLMKGSESGMGAWAGRNAAPQLARVHLRGTHDFQNLHEVQRVQLCRPRQDMQQPSRDC